MDRANLDSFLLFGYFLDYDNRDIVFDFSGIDTSRFNKRDETSILEEGIGFYRNAVLNNFIPGRKQCLPLSGGLDSRAILALLLECTDAENIHTYTFGQPGAMDYEIGNSLASALGTKHTTFNLRNYTYTLDELLDTSGRMDHQTTLFTHPPLWELDNKYADHVIWSGFFGGRVSGSYDIPSPSADRDAALKHYIRKNAATNSYTMSPERVERIKMLIETPDIRGGDIPLDEAFDFHNRQRKYTAKSNFYKGFAYGKPFVDQQLFNFMLSLPYSLRKDQRFYKTLFLKYFPALFRYKSKTAFGTRIDAHPNVLRYYYVKNKMKERINQHLTLFSRQILQDAVNRPLVYRLLMIPNRAYRTAVL